MPEISGKKPCIKCLLSQVPDMQALEKAIQERIALMNEDERAEEQVQRERLVICQGCDHLNSGTCGLCGCYVELRAAKKRMSCPHVPNKW